MIKKITILGNPPSDNTAYICSQISGEQIIFEEQNNGMVIPPTAKAGGILRTLL